MEKITKLYRFEISYNNKPEVWEYDIVKETPCGYWINDWRFKNAHEINSILTHWVSKTNYKRYAYPTQQEALESYIKRKEKHIEYLNKSLIRAKDTIKKAKEVDLSVKLLIFNGGF